MRARNYNRKKFLEMNGDRPHGWLSIYLEEVAKKLRHGRIIELPRYFRRPETYAGAIHNLKKRKEISRTIHLLVRGRRNSRGAHLFMVNMVNFAQKRRRSQ